MLGVRLDIGAAAGRDPGARLGFPRAPDVYADFALQDFRVGGVHMSGKAAWLTAAGGVEGGGGLTLGPAATGPELIVNGGFDADVAGWANAGGLGTSVLSWQAPGAIRNTSPGAGQQRFGQAQTRTVDRVYRARVGVVRAVGSPQISENAPSGSTATGPAMTSGMTGELTWAEASGGLRTLGVITNFPGADYETFDNISLTEVKPFTGFDPAGWTFALRGTAAGSLPATEQVIFAADTDSPGKASGNDRDRVRLSWTPGGDVQLLITRLNVEQVNMTLGAVVAGAAFTVCVTISANDVVASLNGAPAMVDTAAAPPGLACLRIGRSRAGEAFTGVIQQVGVWFGAQPLPIDPARVLAVYGDSTAKGDGATSSWHARLAAVCSPVRAVHNAGVAGQGVGALRDGMAADIRRRDWPCVIYDRRNGGEDATGYLAALAAAVATRTGRLLILPQVPMTSGETGQAVLDAINAGARAAWPDNTFDLADETALLAALSDPGTRTDGLHRNDAGQAIEAAAIKAWFDARGW